MHWNCIDARHLFNRLHKFATMWWSLYDQFTQFNCFFYLRKKCANIIFQQIIAAGIDCIAKRMSEAQKCGPRPIYSSQCVKKITSCENDPVISIPRQGCRGGQEMINLKFSTRNSYELFPPSWKNLQLRFIFSIFGKLLLACGNN